MDDMFILDTIMSWGLLSGRSLTASSMTARSIGETVAEWFYVTVNNLQSGLNIGHLHKRY